ncbi:hypothetical protein WJ08_26975 [Burkholderia vietnamiensis]|nr:hypothetical protein WJ08_26975 [Burkholderia vietnamiensis]KVF41714.1 hypothetical protein WJ10_13745 [Burkholderia vietnamiensis]
MISPSASCASDFSCLILLAVRIVIVDSQYSLDDISVRVAQFLPVRRYRRRLSRVSWPLLHELMFSQSRAEMTRVTFSVDMFHNQYPFLSTIAVEGLGVFRS